MTICPNCKVNIEIVSHCLTDTCPYTERGRRHEEMNSYPTPREVAKHIVDEHMRIGGVIGCWELLIDRIEAELKKIMRSKLLNFVMDEPVYTESIFKVLGKWKGFKVTVWMIFHPHKSAQRSAEAMKTALLRRITREMKDDSTSKETA